MPEVIISGPSGRIEGRFQPSERPDAPLALVLHPHPLYGGTMNNKVVYNIFHSFVRAGFSTLRINFRGVGRSQGTFDDGLGELTDAASALDWMQQQCPDAATCWIGGFSFGALISMQLMMRRPEIEGFISVSPPASMYDFSFLAPCPASGILIQGDSDDIVSEESVSKLASKLAIQKNIRVKYEMVQGADHYFRDRIEKLNGIMDDYLADRMEDFMESRPAPHDKRRRQLPRG